MKDFSPQTWFVRIVTNMRSALHSSAGEISKNSTTLMWQKKVLVNMFNSALSTTPPTLLDWPHVWILACIIFVFITLFFYVVILVKDKIWARSLILKIFPLGKGNQTNHQKLTRGVKRGLLDPQRALFSPLEVLYGTKFGFKHHIMATMANVYKICITDPFLDPWAPPGGHQRAVWWAK